MNEQEKAIEFFNSLPEVVAGEISPIAPKTKTYQPFPTQVKSGIEGICVHCGATNDLTRDHIVPQWFYKGILVYFPITRPYQNTQILCRRCNTFKGGRIDWRHPTSRKFLRSLVGYIYKELDAHSQIPFKPKIVSLSITTHFEAV